MTRRNFISPMGANAGIKALVDVLNAVYEDNEERTFYPLAPPGKQRQQIAGAL